MITMSQKELHRLELIQKIRDGRLSVVQAAEQLGLSRSQVHRLLQAYDQDGTAGLVPRNDHSRATGAIARNFAMRRWI
ncbi:spermidine putrescine ABC transporter permease component PotB-like protein (plasmid) [Agrobacterium tumefaciens LBA4213 (Ach5)]|nr:spermidine putrescine ABC transporter permease component PotB-like protein [Agrobacterium tumefaciens LBA4213 (Ach5)]